MRTASSPRDTLTRALAVLLQCTWGLPQTLLGAFLFLLCRLRGRKHYPLGASVCTEWGREDGVSLGLFIFCPSSGVLTLHEYGHTHQSLLLGPLYLPAILLPSLLWAGLPVFVKLRRRKRIPYSRLYCEAWADRVGDGYALRGERLVKRDARSGRRDEPV